MVLVHVPRLVEGRRVTESPSALLERAAALIEERLPKTSPEPWRVDPLGDEVLDHFGRKIASTVLDVDAEWIALMHPAVGAPLVELLRDAAKRAEAHPHLDPNGSTYQRCALDVARAILGAPVNGEEGCP